MFFYVTVECNSIDGRLLAKSCAFLETLYK